MKTKEIFSRVTNKWQSITDIARDDIDLDLVVKVLCIEKFKGGLVQMYTNKSEDVFVRLNK